MLKRSKVKFHWSIRIFCSMNLLLWGSFWWGTECVWRDLSAMPSVKNKIIHGQILQVDLDALMHIITVDWNLYCISQIVSRSCTVTTSPSHTFLCRLVTTARARAHSELENEAQDGGGECCWLVLGNRRSLSPSPSLQFCLGNKPWQPCYVMRMNHTTIMLDCSLDLPVLLNFLPLPLVYRSILILPCHVRLVVMYICNSPKLSGLPRWQCKDPSIAVDLPEDIARLV